MKIWRRSHTEHASISTNQHSTERHKGRQIVVNRGKKQMSHTLTGSYKRLVLSILINNRSVFIKRKPLHFKYHLTLS